MLLIRPSVEILSLSPGPLELIEVAGRTCYKSEDKITSNSAPDFAKMILKRGHESVIEHASATVRFICDRGVTHEIVRHRLASYSQESTRYCDYSGGHVAFIIPPWCAGFDTLEGEFSDYEEIRGLSVEFATGLWMEHMLEVEDLYKDFRNVHNWKPEQARSLLPNSLKTEIVMTANLREWRHFFKLRAAPAAHPQMREVAIPLLAEFKARIPILFDGIGG